MRFIEIIIMYAIMCLVSIVFVLCISNLLQYCDFDDDDISDYDYDYKNRN